MSEQRDQLQYIEIEPGDGPAAEDGNYVLVHYIGTLDDGTVFDSSYTRGEPIAFVLGRGQVIQGWDLGISRMHVGGKATLIIPPHLGYGQHGAGGVIPPNATLNFDVELVSTAPAAPGSPDSPASVSDGDYTVLPSGLKYYDFAKGDGPQPRPGQSVTVHYTGWLENGTKFDSSLDRGQAFSFPIGAQRVIRGWDEGVVGMCVGGHRQLVIPADMGYGARGAGDVIPPHATLVFEVTLLSVG